MNRSTAVHEYARIVDAAKARAEQLRSEAIDDWFGIAARNAHQVLRSAQRLAHSLARHQRLRAGQRLAG